jgi:hypothetical protein
LGRGFPFSQPLRSSGRARPAATQQQGSPGPGCPAPGARHGPAWLTRTPVALPPRIPRRDPQVLRAVRDCGDQQLSQCRRRAALAVHPDKVGPQGHCAAQRVNHVSRHAPAPARPPASSAGGVCPHHRRRRRRSRASAAAAPPLGRHPRARKSPFGDPAFPLPTPRAPPHAPLARPRRRQAYAALTARRAEYDAALSRLAEAEAADEEGLLNEEARVACPHCAEGFHFVDVHL